MRCDATCACWKLSGSVTIEEARELLLSNRARCDGIGGWQVATGLWEGDLEWHVASKADAEVLTRAEAELWAG